MRATWLPDVLRDAGLPVRLYSGWTSRGSDSWGPIRGVICHATAGSRSSTDEGETRVLWVTGSTSAPVPISQLYLSRSGQWWVGASGRCNHVLVGHKGPHKGFGNSHLIGVEAANDNRGEPWSPKMLESYQRGVAAILKHLKLPASRAVAHREHQNGKSDPAGINMATFRQRVAAYIEGDDDMTKEEFAEALEAALGQADTRAALVAALEHAMPRAQIMNPDSGNPASLAWRLLDTERNVARIHNQVPALAGQLAGLTALVQQLLTAPPVDVTPEQLAGMTAAVERAAATAVEDSLERTRLVVDDQS